MGFMDGAGGGIIGAAIGTLGSLATNYQNKKYQEEQWNREVAHEQATYDRNRADYLADLENERQYNSPSAQMDRLHEAGLNPNLMSGGALTTGNSSSASPMPMGNNVGMAPVQSSDFTSGVVASTSTAVNVRKMFAEISGIVLDNQYKKIVNTYEEEARRLGNDKVAAEIAGIYQSISESMSKVTLNNSTVRLNDKNIELFDVKMLEGLSNVERNKAESALAQAKTAVANLDAQKAQILMPLVGERAAAELALTKAKTATERAAAYQHFAQADLAMIQGMKENALIDAGYADALVAEMTANAESVKENAATARYDAITRRKSFINDVVQQSISAGFDSAKKILHFIPGGKYIW